MMKVIYISDLIFKKYFLGTFMSFSGNKNYSPNYNSEPSSPENQNLGKRNSIEKIEKTPKINMNFNLTKFVWPKSRTLLSIISKMFGDKYINADQRGVLKELIIDRDPTLIQFLNEYEITSDHFKLYQNIISLSNERLK